MKNENETRILNTVELPAGVQRLSEEALKGYEGSAQDQLNQALKELRPNLLATVLFDQEGNPNLDVKWSIFQLLGPVYENKGNVENEENYHNCLRLLLRYAKNVELGFPRNEDNAMLNENIVLSKKALEKYSGKTHVAMMERIFGDTYYPINGYCYAPLAVLAMMPERSSDLKVIAEECGIENIPFDLAQARHVNASGYRHLNEDVKIPGTYTDQNGNEKNFPTQTRGINVSHIASTKGNLQFFERNMVEYLKMKSLAQENPSLEKTVFNYKLGQSRYTQFKKEFKQFPEMLNRAMETAANELNLKNEDLEDYNKLRIASRELEKELMPRMYQNQEDMFAGTVPSMVLFVLTVMTLGALLPITLPIYLAMRTDRPISRKDITSTEQVAYKERTKAEKEPLETPTPAEFSSTQSINEALKEEKSPVKKGTDDQWHLRKVMMPSDEAKKKQYPYSSYKADGKTSVYTTRFDGQRKRFFSQLRAAKKEYREAHKGETIPIKLK